MKTGTVKGESLAKRILDKIKHSALFEMLFNPSSGMVIDPDEVDTEQQIRDLSASTGMSKKEILNIDAAFNKANGDLLDLQTKVTKVPEEPKDSPNPFAVDEEELLRDETESNGSNGGGKEQDEKDQDKGRELGE